MNKGYLMGYIIDNVKFDFILNGKRNSIATFHIVLKNDSIVKVIAYDKDADYCYRKLNKDDLIFVTGVLRPNSDIISDYIYTF